MIPVRRRAGLIGLWVAQIALACLFLNAGGSKLAGAPEMVALFGAAALAATMLGAIATHVFVLGVSPAVPAVLLLAALVVVWARRGQLVAFSRPHSGGS